MSRKQENENINFIEKNIKKCQFNDDTVISYSIEMMKQGYEQMGELNLQYANEGSTSDLKDSVYYEMWLCGV